MPEPAFDNFKYPAQTGVEKYLSFFLLDRLGPAVKVSRPALRMCEMTLFYLK